MQGGCASTSGSALTVRLAQHTINNSPIRYGFPPAGAYYKGSALHSWCLPLPPAQASGCCRHHACGAGVLPPANAELSAGRAKTRCPPAFCETDIMATRVRSRRAMREENDHAEQNEQAETHDEPDTDDPDAPVAKKPR